MTIMVAISETAKAQADALVSSGMYESIGEAIEAALSRLEPWDDEIVDLDDLSPEDRAAVEEGLADIEAGRVVDGETFFAELIAKYEAMAKAG